MALAPARRCFRFRRWHGRKGRSGTAWPAAIPIRRAWSCGRRVTTSGDVTLRCEIARDLDFDEVIATGEIRTGAEMDHTAKWLATGLEPGGTFYYRFWLDSYASPIGRARTLPTGSPERLGIRARQLFQLRLRPFQRLRGDRA